MIQVKDLFIYILIVIAVVAGFFVRQDLNNKFNRLNDNLNISEAIKKNTSDIESIINFINQKGQAVQPITEEKK